MTGWIHRFELYLRHNREMLLNRMATFALWSVILTHLALILLLLWGIEHGW
jgi:hypothetical protein